MRLINADELKADLHKWFPQASLEGIEAKTLFAQILADIDNTPTVSDHSVEIAQKSIELGRRVGKAEAELYREETCKSKDSCDDYKYWHCKGCNGCKKGGAENG